jgi:hypothetical protein
MFLGGRCATCPWRIPNYAAIGVWKSPQQSDRPGEVIEIRPLACSRAASLEGRPATQSGVDTPLVIVVGESIQLAMETVPGERLVEILAPEGSDKALDKRV